MSCGKRRFAANQSSRSSGEDTRAGRQFAGRFINISARGRNCRLRCKLPKKSAGRASAKLHKLLIDRHGVSEWPNRVRPFAFAGEPFSPAFKVGRRAPFSEIILLVANRNRVVRSQVLNRLAQSSNRDTGPSGLWHKDILENLKICSPKRNSRAQTGWQGFFPYYAGYPETFARTLLESAGLQRSDIVLDPWNGSGTTTYTASHLGLTSRGFDLNPVMVVVARARLLAASEADSIEPLAADVISDARAGHKSLDAADPLECWFTTETALSIRAIEGSIRRHLLGKMTMTRSGTKLDRISGMAATFYVALFSVCRMLASPFQSSNPTWLRRPRENEVKVEAAHAFIAQRLADNLRSMAEALVTETAQPNLLVAERGVWDVRHADSTSADIPAESVDLILTSPPYCTRIDYTGATRVELAILAPLLRLSAEDLGRQMIGSTRVPEYNITPSSDWGATCNRFLEALRKHPSKASSGYYYLTHLDYFSKMSKSLSNLVKGLKRSGVAVLVVQNSFYKDQHNDLPTIIGEMAEAQGLALVRREDFHLRRTMAGINPRARVYRVSSSAVKSALCFRKN